MIERLYTIYYEELLRFCLSLSGQRPAAEDIVQETYLRALGNLDTLEGLSDAKCRAWLYRTARNVFIDKIRRAKLEPQAEAETFWEDDLSRIMVAQLCSQLPAGEGQLFWMRYMEGYNSTELGRFFHLPPSTIRAKLASARRNITALYTHNKPGLPSRPDSKQKERK